jgi:hypothetical protein
VPHAVASDTARITFDVRGASIVIGLFLYLAGLMLALVLVNVLLLRRVARETREERQRRVARPGREATPERDTRPPAQ